MEPQKQVALITCYNSVGELLLGLRLDTGLWTLPGGGLNEGELAVEGARRELMEETGLEARTLSPLTVLDLPNGPRLHIFSAYVSGSPHGRNDPDQEVSEWRFVNVSEGLPKEYADKLYGPKDVDLNIVLRLFNIQKGGPMELSKSEIVKDEIHRLLCHPNTAERSMALKLGGIQGHHLVFAVRDPHPPVFQAAIDHSLWDSQCSYALMIAPGYQAAKKYLLQSTKVTEDDLGHFYDSATPEDRDDVLTALVTHPALNAKMVSTLYTDIELSLANRLELLKNPHVAQEVFKEIISTATKTPGFPLALAKQAVAGASNEDLNKLVEAAIGSTRPDLQDLAGFALRNRTFSSQEIYHYLGAMKVFRNSAHAALRVSAVSGPGALPEHMAFLMRDFDPMVEQILHTNERLAPEHIDSIVKSADMDTIKTFFTHPSWRPAHLETMLRRAPLQKSANNLLDTGTYADHPLVQDMLGFAPHMNDAFKAARFLSGSQEIPLDAVRSALYACDGDPVAAALAAYGFPISPESRKSLVGVMSFSSVQKAEPVSETANQVTAPHPEGQEVAESVSRAFADGYVYTVNLKGRHSAGAMIARDSAGNKVWLLKPGVGGVSPAAGSADDVSSASAREAAWYQLSMVVGLDKWFQKTELLNIDGKEYAAIELLSFDYRNLDKLSSEDGGASRRILSPLLSDGTLHKLAALDWVLGNPDRHLQNGLANHDGDLKLIDHGSAFAGTHFNPGVDQNSFVPFYLRAWSSDPSFNGMSIDSKLRSMPRVSSGVAEEIKMWIHGILQTQILPILWRYGISPGPILDRLRRLKNLVNSGPSDADINRVWVSDQIADTPK